jgi:uncharacterized protein (DUF1330 family)
MKTLAVLLSGVAIGALAVQGIHAQAKPPAYLISEIDITNPDGYGKEYAPRAQASIKAHGGRFLAVGGSVQLGATSATPVVPYGRDVPKRFTLIQWDSMEQLRAWREGAEYKAIREIGDKYAKFEALAVEGVPQ